MKSATKTSVASILPELEALAQDYQLWRSAGATTPAAGLRELPDYLWPHFTERHLQCLWYDPRLRPANLRDRTGEPVEVESPGEWNLEDGPDFRRARIRVGGRLVTGDVEIHIHPRDWKQHGHQHRPQYDAVRIHVTYFSGTAEDGCFRPGVVHIPVAEALRELPGFSFESIDLTAYPYSVPVPPTACRPFFQQLGPDFATAFLEAAGAERLRRKAQRLSALARQVGIPQALYEETMSALGYRHNKHPCRLLAARAPLELMQERCNGNELSWYAVLLGVANLLPADVPSSWPAAARQLIRRLWDMWWEQAELWRDRCLDRGLWQTSGVRPANQPVRRLAAAAHCFSRHSLPELFAEAARQSPDQARLILDHAFNPDGSFWSHRLSWSGAVLSRPIALVGRDRLNALIGNVVLPAAAAFAWSPGPDQPLRRIVPAETLSSIARQTAFALFGRDHPPSIYRSGLARHGLLQIAADFCLRGPTRCQDCPLPAYLNRC